MLPSSLLLFPWERWGAAIWTASRLSSRLCRCLLRGGDACAEGLSSRIQTWIAGCWGWRSRWWVSGKRMNSTWKPCKITSLLQRVMVRCICMWEEAMGLFNFWEHRLFLQIILGSSGHTNVSLKHNSINILGKYEVLWQLLLKDWRKRKIPLV